MVFKFLAVSVAALLWLAYVAVRLHELKAEPVRSVLDRLGRLGWVNRVAFLIVIAHLTMFAGAKHGTNDVTGVDGTNVVEIVESGTNDVEDAGNGEVVSSPLLIGFARPLTSGEDTASPFVSAQIELMRNGDFITRSNEVECVYRRVIEPNPIGPGNPEDPDNPGMPVCPYGPAQDLSVIQETSAYCWVDIVVNNADSWVRFEGDGASNLADPSFAAKAGETNHVVILIGKAYKVTCDMPFTVVAKSDPAIDERWEDDRTVWLNWPVVITALEDGDGPRLLSAGLRLMGAGPTRKGFTMCVVPSFLGGTFVWTESLNRLRFRCHL